MHPQKLESRNKRRRGGVLLRNTLICHPKNSTIKDFLKKLKITNFLDFTFMKLKELKVNFL